MQEAMRSVAGLMALAARTAPKTAGKDHIELRVIEGADLVRLADAMLEYGMESGKKNFDRDAENVRHSQAMLLVSVIHPTTAGLNCGACGYDRCGDMPDRHDGREFAGPQCFWRGIDMGIALGSAVKTAGLLNADNRIMYRAGVVARRLGLIEGDVVLGVPLSATGKNIYFDR